jgi:hypothetical protein
MKKFLLGLLILPFLAAGPAPTGEFTLAISGHDVTVTLSNITHLTKNDETTLGTWCFRADGTQIPMGNRGNPYIFEVNWFGTWDPRTFTLPSDAVTCTSQLIAAEWRNGQVLRVWVLDGPDTYGVT